MDDILQIRKRLFSMQDEKYREFHLGLIPGVPPESVIGIRTPLLRGYGRELIKENKAEEFIGSLPHEFYDENVLHAILISAERNFDRAVGLLDDFLPYVDNWAVCDIIKPAAFKNHPAELPDKIRKWINAEHTYTVRFGIGMLMSYYLDSEFDPKFPELVAGIKSDEYYINMMIAWYFATALAKQYDAVIPYIREHRLSPWVHNKSIQKSIESRRITDKQKSYLRSLKINQH